MFRFFKLHIGLYRYLKEELKKKRTLKELIKFLSEVGVSYLKETLKLYKNLFMIFNKEYRKQKKEYNKMQRIKLDLKRALKMLQYIDKNMIKMGKNRQERRQFWRDFYRDAQVRNEVFESLEKEIK
jgi:uroporphyrinogen-III decarboxylase